MNGKWFCVLGCCAFVLAARATESHADQIVADILAQVKALKATDPSVRPMAFSRYVATQPALPGGAKGIAVMINGHKTVPGYTEHFRCVEQVAVREE